MFCRSSRLDWSAALLVADFFVPRPPQRVVLLDRQGFASQHGLADEQVAGFDQADVRRDHVASAELHDIAGHQFAHRHFAQHRRAALLWATQDGGSGAHHGLEGFGGLGRAVFLPESQQAAQADHGHDNDDLGQVGVVAFTLADRQPVVGEEADTGQGQEHIDEGIVQGFEQLDEGVRRLVVGDFVVATTHQTAFGFEFSQAVSGGVEVGEGYGQAVFALPGRHASTAWRCRWRRPGWFFCGFFTRVIAVLLPQACGTTHRYSANQRRAHICRAVNKRSSRMIVF